MIKSKRIRWAGRVVRMGRGEVYSGVWWGNLSEKDHLEDSGVDGSAVIRWAFRKWDVGVWTGWIWFKMWTGGRHSWNSNEPSGSL